MADRLVITSATAILALTLTGCASQAQQTKGQAAPPAPTVEIATVTPQDTAIFAEFPGQTFARNLVEIRARVDGYVEKWLFKPGEMVKAGQPLYILDLRPLRAQVQQAQGTVQQAEADLSFASQQVALLQAQANLEAARSNLVKAQQDFNRLKPLVEQDAAARQDLDAATAALRAAESNVRANEAIVEQARLNTVTQVQSAKGRVQQQQAALTTANLNLEYGTLRSPAAGRVGDSNVAVGGLVTENSTQPLTTVAPLDPMYVRFKVSESQHMAFAGTKSGNKGVGPPLELYLADNTKFPHSGRIDNTLNQVDPRTGTLEIQARFPNPQGVLLPGQFGRVRFQTSQRQGVLLVPQRAVQQNQSIQSVFVVGSGNKIEARPVKTAERVGSDWIIEQGLNAGDKVVVEGLLSVRPGVVVNPVPFKNEKAPR